MTHHQPPAPPPAQSTPRAPASGNQPSLGELIVRISENILALVRGEIDLAKAKGMRMAKTMGLGAGLLGAAGVLALYGFGLLLGGIVYVLHYLLPLWASLMIVSFILFLIAAVLAYLGKQKLDQSKADIPDPKAGLKQSVDALKGASR